MKIFKKYNKKYYCSTKQYIYKRIYAFKNLIKLIKKKRREKKIIAVQPIQDFWFFFLFHSNESKLKMYLKFNGI